MRKPIDMPSGWRPAFSLIELMVVLAIIGLLAAMLMPALHGFVVRAKRVQAQAALLQLMQQQERYYSQHTTYLAFSSASASVDPQQMRFKWWSGDTALTSAYEIQASACSNETLADCVLLQAIPGTAQVDAHFTDADCGTLSVNSRGVQAASGPAPRCWP